MNDSKKLGTIHICPYCKKSFRKEHSGQKYCCRNCCKKYHKKVNKIYPVTDTVLRKFFCKMCGTLVIVCNKKDRRTKFCSTTCVRKWFRHYHKST